MSRLRFGGPPKVKFWSLRPLAVSALALALGACSTAQSTTSADAPRSSIAQANLEADGLEAQVPPPKRIRQIPDDPTEPFSPNYGPPPLPSSPEGENVTLPDDLPRDFRKQLASALAD